MKDDGGDQQMAENEAPRRMNQRYNKMPVKIKQTIQQLCKVMLFLNHQVQAKESVRGLSSGIRVGENDNQPPPKKLKGD